MIQFAGPDILDESTSSSLSDSVFESSGGPEIELQEEFISAPIPNSPESPELLCTEDPTSPPIPDTPESPEPEQNNESSTYEGIISEATAKSINEEVASAGHYVSSDGIITQPIVNENFDAEDGTRVFVPQMWVNRFPQRYLERVIRHVVAGYLMNGTFMTLGGVRTKLHICAHGHVIFQPEHLSISTTALKRNLLIYPMVSFFL